MFVSSLLCGTVQRFGVVCQVMESVVVIIFLISLVIGPLLWWIVTKNNQKQEGEDKSVGLQKEEEIQDLIPEKQDRRVLHPVNWKKFLLLESTPTSHNTKLLKFQIPNHEPLGLPVGRHLSVMAHIDGNKVMRPYTPVSRPDEVGSFSLLVKAYEYGKMSHFLTQMQVGDSLEVRGPIGRFKYSTNMYKHIVFVCGGTGLTPCLQVIRWILEGPEHEKEETRLTLFYQNRTVPDILLLSTLELLEASHPLLKVFYHLSDPPATWGMKTPEVEERRERRGYIHEDNMRAEHIYPEKCDLVCVCGPSGFNDSMVGLFERLGYDNGKNIYVW
jgi:cytochrome-b5 reductase